MKTIVILMLGVVIGVLLGRYSSTPIPLPMAMHQNWADAGVQKISEMKNPGEQLREAEKYYGKAVVLFLASLHAQAMASNQSLVPAVSEEIIKTTHTEPEAGLAIEPTVVPVTDTTPKKPLTPAELKVAKAQEDIQRLVSYRQSAALKKMTPEARRLIGSFEGTFIHETGKLKGRADKVDLDLMLEMQEGKLAGQVKIVFSDPDGKAYSTSNGGGDNQTLKDVAGEPGKIYVQTSPGEFILMNVSRPENLTGDYYDAGGVYQGKVRVWRK